MGERQLAVADTHKSAHQLAEAAYANDIPGFQAAGFANHKGRVAMVGAIEGASEAVLGYRVPITGVVEIDCNGESVGYHIDGTQAGLAVHENFEGGGTVALAFARGTITQGNQTVFFERSAERAARLKYGIFDRSTRDMGDMDSNTWLSGTLASGIMTVFSEGNLPGLRPTIHSFMREGGQSARWKRYCTSIGDIGGESTDADALRAQVMDYWNKKYLARHGLVAVRTLRRHPARSIVETIGSEYLDLGKLNGIRLPAPFVAARMACRKFIRGKFDVKAVI